MSDELKELIANLIYEADWNIEHNCRDIHGFYMIDEKETIDAIIKAVKESLL